MDVIGFKLKAKRKYVNFYRQKRVKAVNYNIYLSIDQLVLIMNHKIVRHIHDVRETVIYRI